MGWFVHRVYSLEGRSLKPESHLFLGGPTRLSSSTRPIDGHPDIAHKPREKPKSKRRMNDAGPFGKPDFSCSREEQNPPQNQHQPKHKHPNPPCKPKDIHLEQMPVDEFILYFGRRFLTFLQFASAPCSS